MGIYTYAHYRQQLIAFAGLIWTIHRNSTLDAIAEIMRCWFNLAWACDEPILGDGFSFWNQLQLEPTAVCGFVFVCTSTSL